MMRLGRRASLLAGFSLLASAATAYAECAWVMWERRQVISPTPKNNSTAWYIREAYESKPTCRDGAQQYVDVIAASSIEMRGLGPRELVRAQGDTELVEAYRESTTLIKHLLRCLPANVDPKLLFEADTVDPRGPKGK